MTGETAQSARKALVTGATGLLGYHVVRNLLKEGREVRALVRSRGKASGILPADCEIAVGDITDPDSLGSAVRGCPVIYHCAGLPEQWLPDPERFFKVNAGGTENIVRAAEQEGISRLVYISTVDLFDVERGQPYNEQAPMAPKKSPYGQSKYEADEIVSIAVQNGLPGVFIHPGAIYGPFYDSSQWFLKLVTDLANKRIPLLPPGGLPMVYVDDVARGCILAETMASIGQRYILNSAYLTWREMGDIICRKLGLDKTPGEIPGWLAITIAGMAEALSGITKKPPIFHKALVRFWLIENQPQHDKARRDLGWNPVTFTEGVELTVNSLRESGVIK